MDDNNFISEDELKNIRELRKKRYTTIELYEPNMWGVWNDNHVLSTYEVTDKLNEYSKANEKLEIENAQMKKILSRIVRVINAEHHRRYYDCNVELTKQDYELLSEMMNNERW